MKDAEEWTRKNNEIRIMQKPYYERPKFKLYQADCLELLESLAENSVDMVFADPPYNLSNGGFTVHAGRLAHEYSVRGNNQAWKRFSVLRKRLKFAN